MNETVTIRWLGHSCFRMEYAGFSLVTDPYEDGYIPGLAPLHVGADEVDVFHGPGHELDAVFDRGVGLVGRGSVFHALHAGTPAIVVDEHAMADEVFRHLAQVVEHVGIKDVLFLAMRGDVGIRADEAHLVIEVGTAEGARGHKFAAHALKVVGFHQDALMLGEHGVDDVHAPGIGQIGEFRKVDSGHGLTPPSPCGRNRTR